MARPRIAIVITFFGRAPLWLPAFLLSCARNKDVTWLLYTDVEITAPIPANVMLKPMPIAELGARASEVFGTTVDFSIRRKLCDLKPAYGLVFADDLKDFDFWACSDLDIVWGDIRKFATDRILESYDIFSSRMKRISGHLTLFRNTSAVNRTFTVIPDIVQAMAEPYYMHLDERELTRYLLEHLARQPLRPTPRVYWPEELTVDADYQRALGDGDADSLWWKNGRTFDAQGRELMYVHFHKLKQTMKTINFGFADAPAAFRMTRAGFFA